ncbi:MAG: pilus assembly protein [Mycobacteriales bacterium]
MTRSASSSRSPVRGDAGSSAIELVLLTPVLIALVFGLVQTALVWNARQLMGAAAQDGARLARTAVALQSLDTTAGAGADDAVRTSTLGFLRQTGGASLQAPTVTVLRNGDYVTVTVTARTTGVFPGWALQVRASSRTPVEGFRP